MRIRGVPCELKFSQVEYYTRNTDRTLESLCGFLVEEVDGLPEVSWSNVAFETVDPTCARFKNQTTSDSLQPNSDGLQPTSDGLQIASRMLRDSFAKGHKLISRGLQIPGTTVRQFQKLFPPMRASSAHVSSVIFHSNLQF